MNTLYILYKYPIRVFIFEYLNIITLSNSQLKRMNISAKLQIFSLGEIWNVLFKDSKPS